MKIITFHRDRYSSVMSIGHLDVIALNATNITINSFVANWVKNSVVNKYYLDVATNEDFTSLILNNVDVGNTTSHLVENLDEDTYYYRLRGSDGIKTGDNSNTISVKVEKIITGLGYLYNYYAAADLRYIVAAGWHVPNNSELLAMVTYLGGADVAGAKLKEIGTVYWNFDPGSTNSSGFNARGSGRRDWEAFRYLASVFHMITTTTAGENYYFLRLDADSNGCIINSVSALFTGGSIRPVKDITTLTNGQTGVYQGNDLKLYNTVCIGNQEFLSKNLAETKYRNGATIYEVTDQAEWIALKTGAFCAYNNNHNYE